MVSGFVTSPCSLADHLGRGELDPHRLEVGGLVTILFEKRASVYNWLPAGGNAFTAQSFSSFSSCTSRQRLWSSLMSTLNDSGTPGSGGFSPLTIAS